MRIPKVIGRVPWFAGGAALFGTDRNHVPADTRTRMIAWLRWVPNNMAPNANHGTLGCALGY